jgi:protein-disulfide isomerase
MKPGSLKVLAVIAIAALAVWGLLQRSPSYGGNAAAADVLAVVGGVELTRKDVEAQNPDQFQQARRQLHQLTEQTLDQAIRRQLLELEAEERRISVQELLAAEVDARVPEPSEAQVDSVYQAYRDQLDLPIDSVAGRIRDFLRSQSRQDYHDSFLAVLTGQYGVENRLEMPRTDVASAGFPSRGPDDAPVTIVEFGDFECPFCYRVIAALEQVLANYGDQVRLVYRQFPLNSIHRHAQKAAEASLCAREQGRFWEMHDAMFADQRALAVDDLKQTAVRLGMDGEAFGACLDDGRHVDEIADDFEAGRRAGITGTPALFINGRFLSGAQPYDVIARVIDDELRRIEGRQ